MKNIRQEWTVATLRIDLIFNFSNLGISRFFHLIKNVDYQWKFFSLEVGKNWHQEALVLPCDVEYYLVEYHWHPGWMSKMASWTDWN